MKKLFNTFKLYHVKYFRVGFIFFIIMNTIGFLFGNRDAKAIEVADVVDMLSLDGAPIISLVIFIFSFFHSTVLTFFISISHVLLGDEDNENQ